MFKVSCGNIIRTCTLFNICFHLLVHLKHTQSQGAIRSKTAKKVNFMNTSMYVCVYVCVYVCACF